MRCQNRVVYATQKRKNASKTPIIVSRLPSPIWEKMDDHYRQILKKNVERDYVIHHVDDECGGIIVSDINFDPGYFFGGADPVFEIKFRCSKCGETNFPGLPNDLDEVNEILTSYIKDM